MIPSPLNPLTLTPGALLFSLLIIDTRAKVIPISLILNTTKSGNINKSSHWKIVLICNLLLLALCPYGVHYIDSCKNVCSCDPLYGGAMCSRLADCDDTLGKTFETNS